MDLLRLILGCRGFRISCWIVGIGGSLLVYINLLMRHAPPVLLFSAGYDHPTLTSAYFAVFFHTAQQVPHPFLVVEGVAGFPEEQLTVLDHFKF